MNGELARVFGRLVKTRGDSSKHIVGIEQEMYRRGFRNKLSLTLGQFCFSSTKRSCVIFSYIDTIDAKYDDELRGGEDKDLHPQSSPCWHDK